MSKSMYTDLLRKLRLSWRLLPAAVIGIVMIMGGIAGCAGDSAESLIQSKVANILSDRTVEAITAWDREIIRINADLTAVQTKLGKVEQVATPAVKWVEFITAKAKQEQWNGRKLEVTSDLNKLKNDKYTVAKLQVLAEMLTAGMRYTSTILIDDLTGGQVTPYEELRDGLKAQITTLSQQREARAKLRNTARSTGIDALKMAGNWKVQKVNSITYNVSGQGLGMATALTSGIWTYSSDTEQLIPQDTTAAALQKVLTGK